MNFESLANELILDLFEYFDGFHVLRTFYGLNSRLNQLLCYHFGLYVFNLQSMSRSNFDLICREYFPLISNRVISLQLSNDDETPNLLHKFLSRHRFRFDQFTSLKSLSLDSIESVELLNQIVVQCQPLRYLQQLKITNFTVRYVGEQDTDLMNHIWSLPLIHCCFENFYYNEQCFLDLHVTSNTMNYLAINGFHFDLTVLCHLFKYTPALRRLSFSCHCHADDELTDPRTSSSIHSFKLDFHGSINVLTVLFEHLPNLYSLTITMTDACLNGMEWERMLLDYLPNVRKLRFRMNFPLSDNEENEKQVNRLLQTFQSEFWIEQHQWFVQCDWDASERSELIFVYTLPYDFNDFFYYDTTQSKSTRSNSIEYPVYDRVRTLRQSFSDDLLMNETIKLTPRFSSITDLQLILPLSDHFCSCLTSLNQLKSLHVTVLEKSSYHQQLQFLLDRAPNLYSLTLRSQRHFDIDLTNISSVSVRRLDLRSKSQYHLDYFDEQDCQFLPQSSLGKQCEVLLISVKTRSTITELTSRMSNLRSLTFQCKDDKCIHRESIPGNDKFLQWLSKHLPRKCSIIRNEQQLSKIHLWIK